MTNFNRQLFQGAGSDKNFGRRFSTQPHKSGCDDFEANGYYQSTRPADKSMFQYSVKVSENENSRSSQLDRLNGSRDSLHFENENGKGRRQKGSWPERRGANEDVSSQTVNKYFKSADNLVTEPTQLSRIMTSSTIRRNDYNTDIDDSTISPLNSISRTESLITPLKRRNYKKSKNCLQTYCGLRNKKLTSANSSRNGSKEHLGLPFHDTTTYSMMMNNRPPPHVRGYADSEVSETSYEPQPPIEDPWQFYFVVDVIYYLFSFIDDVKSFCCCVKSGEENYNFEDSSESVNV